MTPFHTWTPEQVREHFPNASPSFVHANSPGGQGDLASDGATTAPKPDSTAGAARGLDVSPQMTTAEAKLNKLEKARLAYLRSIKMESLRIQSITLHLGHDCRYTADFTYLAGSRMVFEDTKGPHTWEDSLIKLRTAARQFPEFIFKIVRRSPEGWQSTIVKP